VEPNGIKQNLRVITLGDIAGVDGHHRYYLIVWAGSSRELINLGGHPMQTGLHPITSLGERIRGCLVPAAALDLDLASETLTPAKKKIMFA
jgi:hypothetical protein